MMHIMDRLKYLGLLVLLLFEVSGMAQQLPLYSQFRNAEGLINPASVNSDFFLSEYNVNFAASYRAQWINQEETPRTLFLSGEYISTFGGNFELLSGIQFLQDQTGPFSLNGVYGRIGSLLTEDPYWGAFGIGLSFGLINYRVSANRIVWKDIDDPQIPLNNLQFNRPDIGMGLYYYKRLGGRFLYQDNIYAGISVPQLLGSTYTIEDGSNEVPITRPNHFYATAGWYHFLNEQAFLELSTWMRYVEGAPFNVTLNARFQLGRTVWFGGGVNINGLISLETGINVPGLLGKDTNFRLGYAFDYNTSAFDLPLGTSHELTFAIQFDTYD